MRKKPYLVHWNLQETLREDYKCPLCGALMSSGIWSPRGDRGDWLLHPHCTNQQCNFSTEGDKDPFGECIPATPVEEHIVGYQLALVNGRTSFHVSAPIPNGKKFGRTYHLHGGGGMYEGASVRVLPFSVHRRADEASNDFYFRAKKEFDEFLQKV